MKLKDFAKKMNITYRTAHKWWKAGYLNGRYSPGGSIILDDENPEKTEEEINEIKNNQKAEV